MVREGVGSKEEVSLVVREGLGIKEEVSLVVRAARERLVWL